MAGLCNIMFCVDEAKNLKLLVDRIPMIGHLCYYAKYDQNLKTAVNIKIRKRKWTLKNRKLEKNAFRLQYADFENIIRYQRNIKVC